MGIIVHHLDESRSERIPWILEELGVPYEVKVHYRTSAGVAPKSLKAISPFGKAPCIELDGEILTESGHIVHTLIEKYSTGDAVEKTTSSSSNFWSHFSEASFMNYMVANRVATLGAASLTDAADRPGAKKLAGFFKGYAGQGIASGLAEIERFLGSHPNFSGSDKLGEGDIMIGWALFIIAPANGKRPFKMGPNTEAWIKKTRAREAYIRAQERITREEKEQRQAKL